MKKAVKHFINRCLCSYCFMFHHIDNGSITPKSRCVLSYEKFLDILDSGLEFMPIDSYVAGSGKDLYKCAITFDDALKDVYTVAYPELCKRHIPFTVFVIVDFLDKEGYITTQELMDMSKNPLVTIASHGMTHSILKGMSIEQQKHEILESKKVLEELINKEVKYFAFSHGLYDENTIRVLKKHSNYQAAFGVDRFSKNILTRHWKYHLPRINCENGQTLFNIVCKKNKKILLLK